MTQSYIIENSQGEHGANDQGFDKRRRKVKDFTRVISFTSGKGGVGKTNTVVNTAIALSRLGNEVLILDADLGLANVDILLGIQPRHTLQDVLNGSRRIDDIILHGPQGISIIPAASGVESICNLDVRAKQLLLSAVENISLDFDYLLIDTRAGISSDVMYFNSAASEIVVVINPEPTSLTDAYAVIKVLATHYGEKSFSVVANDVRDGTEGNWAFQQLQRAVDRFLRVQLRYIGHVPTDPSVSEAVRRQRTLLELFPSCPAGLAFNNVAKKIDEERAEYRIKGGMQFFFRQLLDSEQRRGL